MGRYEEVRQLMRMSRDDLLKQAEGRLVIVEDLDALHEHMAESIASEIRSHNAEGKPTRLILPVGPTGQYPILLEIVHKEKLSMKNCYVFFMDEYCDDDGRVVDPSHPLSFRGTMARLFFDRLDNSLAPPAEQVVFPDHRNVHELAGAIDKAGGIDACFGGIGIHGHVAFNEPERNVARSNPRVVYLNDFTLTINAIRAHVGGNLENFPRKAVTLGMRQILGAKRICLYCRNGTPYDWANTILRIALFGTPGDDYPVTHIRDKDYLIVTDEDTAAAPQYVL